MTRIAAFVVVCTLLSTAFAGDEDTGGKDLLMNPGPEHATLAKMVGKWDVAVKLWMDPSQPPAESKGTAEFKMSLGGRFLQEEYKGEMMGQPMTGFGCVGYDRAAGKFTSYWADDVSTAATYLVGTSKDGGKTVEYSGDMTDTSTGKMVRTRWTSVHPSDDESDETMYVQHEGKEVKAMELTYTRKK